MSRLEDMQIYVEVLTRGSFSQAATQLGLSKQYVSRRVAALEERLGVRLLHRTTRQLSPTSLGMDYLERASRVLAAADEADQAISSHSVLPKGKLRLSAPMSYGQEHLPSLVNGFLQQCPEVQIEVDLSDRIVDLLSEGYDMAIRIGRLPDSSLLARKIATVRYLTVASPTYLVKHKPLQHPEQLKQHTCLLYGHGQASEWQFRLSDGQRYTVGLSGRYRSNNGELLLAAAIDGLGITQIPDFIAAPALAAGRLQMVLSDFERDSSVIQVVYPQHRQPNTVVRAFIDFLVAASHGK
ncbi:LysR family transcriptional regulator [Neisseriaceae bacterium TC5R-5]|nr:LysR family transcriptional regulator [Neisseriaceae bacterium TC5R-5]